MMVLDDDDEDNGNASQRVEGLEPGVLSWKKTSSDNVDDGDTQD